MCPSADVVEEKRSVVQLETPSALLLHLQYVYSTYTVASTIKWFFFPLFMQEIEVYVHIIFLFFVITSGYLSALLHNESEWPACLSDSLRFLFSEFWTLVVLQCRILTASDFPPYVLFAIYTGTFAGIGTIAFVTQPVKYVVEHGEEVQEQKNVVV